MAAFLDRIAVAKPKPNRGGLAPGDGLAGPPSSGLAFLAAVAQVSDMTPTVVLVAHGQPSDPAPAETDVARLAERVATELPDWTVRSATLAAPEALAVALEGTEAPVVFPFFMADGWFIRTALPDRLTRAGATDARILQPFGLMPEVHELAAAVAAEAARANGWRSQDCTLILAAHGSGRSPYPAEAAQQTARAIADRVSFAAIRTGFIEEAPYLAEAASGAGPRALCLPLFVARWGHVVDDIPAALSKAAFSGVLLDPIGTLEDVPGLIARALARAGRSLF
jgi:sirohydrochlorin ferrochelatase